MESEQSSFSFSESFIINNSDIKSMDNGFIVLKRKYGKFTRPVFRVKKNTND